MDLRERERERVKLPFEYTRTAYRFISTIYKPTLFKKNIRNS
jgi:hypothetical protein